ncbi:hypothetical protein OS493_003723 [Desmophyllum pertusum]|uniref:Uncharacterized protein n=1 Tax=Desmophyllum pertusum TaxID=174260 RepID=A0A9X0DBP9_9CNID|nr:hypothetical protein OS493_003723 [Desmophyllum pertusum]
MKRIRDTTFRVPLHKLKQCEEFILCTVGGDLECSADTSKAQTREKSTACNYSDEAQRVGLEAFLRKVKSTYYKMNPNNVVYDPDSTPKSIRRDFSPYNAHPNAIRDRTDAARALCREANKLDKNADGNKLKPRERKGYSSKSNTFYRATSARHTTRITMPELGCLVQIHSAGNRFATWEAISKLILRTRSGAYNPRR